MGTDSVAYERTESLPYTWGAGVAGGVVGGVGMGVILHAGANMMPFIGALYGWPTVVGGWVAHLAHSVLIGLLFTLIVSRPMVRDETRSISGCMAVGVTYAAAVGLVTAGVMVPIAMNLIGAQTFPEPIMAVPGPVGGFLVIISVGVAHMVYGVLLGWTYGYIHTNPLSSEQMTD